MTTRPVFIAKLQANGEPVADSVIGVVTMGTDPVRVTRWPSESFTSLRRRAAQLLPDEQLFTVAYRDHDPDGRFAGAREACLLARACSNHP